MAHTTKQSELICRRNSLRDIPIVCAASADFLLGIIKMSKLILLTQGKHAIVDDENYYWLNRWKWYAHKERNNFYAFRGRDDIKMHRLIMGAKKGQQIDHRNRGGLDNRRYNLRFCTNAQNLQNARKRKNCSSQYKGVCWDKSKKKWIAYIGLNQKLLFLGRYDSEIEAANIYNKKAKKLFGEFERLNLTGN